MKAMIHEQEIEIDLEEIAYQAAQGDVCAFGDMLVQFCDHLEARERKAGYSDLKFFSVVFEILTDSISESQIGTLKEIVNSKA